MPHVVAPTIESKWVALGIEYSAPVGQPENASQGFFEEVMVLTASKSWEATALGRRVQDGIFAICCRQTTFWRSWSPMDAQHLDQNL
jgi:hypothetical protein